VVCLGPGGDYHRFDRHGGSGHLVGWKARDFQFESEVLKYYLAADERKIRRHVMFSSDLEINLKKGNRLWRCLLINNDIHLREFIITSVRKMPEGYKKASLVEIVYGVTCTEKKDGKLSIKKVVDDRYKHYVEVEEEDEALFPLQYMEYAASDTEAMIECLQLYLNEQARLSGDRRRIDMETEEDEFYPGEHGDPKLWVMTVVNRLLKSIRNKLNGRGIKVVYNRGTFNPYL
jgi:hypothetical protein